MEAAHTQVRACPRRHLPGHLHSSSRSLPHKLKLYQQPDSKKASLAAPHPPSPTASCALCLSLPICRWVCWRKTAQDVDGSQMRTDTRATSPSHSASTTAVTRPQISKMESRKARQPLGRPGNTDATCSNPNPCCHHTRVLVGF